MSSTRVLMEPVYGGKTRGAVCSLLRVDDLNILLDCGWDAHMSPDSVAPLARVAPSVHIVLLTHADMHHAGALPYAMRHLGLKATIFATVPTPKLCKRLLYDLLQCHLDRSGECVINEDDIDEAFDRVRELKYSQRYSLSDLGEGITITPYCAGHSLGGAVWKLQKDTDEIVYLNSCNHLKENHLNGLALEHLHRPSAIICGSTMPYSKSMPRKERNKVLGDIVVDVLRRQEGNVLIPVETVGRVFELLLALDARLASLPYPVVFLSNLSSKTIEFIRSQLEWMNDHVIKNFDINRGNPFDFHCPFHACSTIEEVERLPGPKIVLATSLNMGQGFSRDLLVRWGVDARNAVVLTELPDAGTLADSIMQGQKDVEFELWQRVPLEGAELRVWEEDWERQRREKIRKLEEKMMDIKTIHDEGDGQGGGGGKPAYKVTPGLILPPGLHYSSRYLMFPAIEKTYDADEFGEFVMREMFPRTAITGHVEEVQAKERRMKEELGEEEEYEVPTKPVMTQISMSLACSIHRIPFDGLSDESSVKNILAQLRPRKLVLIHGTSEEIASLREHCVDRGTFERVDMPEDGQSVDISMGSNIHRVVVEQSVMEHVEFTRVGEYDVAYLEGMCVPPTPEMVCSRPEEDVTSQLLGVSGKRPAAAADGEMEVDSSGVGEQAVDQKSWQQAPLRKRPKIDYFITRVDPSMAGHTEVYIGSFRLHKLKEALEEAGWKTLMTESEKGILKCGQVKICKSAPMHILIKGNLSPEYFAVRRVLYDLFDAF